MFLAALGFAVTVAPRMKSPERTPWAYQPVQRPDPAVENANGFGRPSTPSCSRNSRPRGSRPRRMPTAPRSSAAPRSTPGVAATPEEVRAFEKDRSRMPTRNWSTAARLAALRRALGPPLARPGALCRQRRLQSRRYAANIWRYRDYVIKAFNDDKPYDRFVKEQLAGDEIWPDDQEALIATGFLRTSRRDQRARPELKKQEIANDITDTVGTVLLGRTVGCAHATTTSSTRSRRRSTTSCRRSS